MKRFLALALCWCILLPVHAQTSTGATEKATAAFDTSTFPQWAKDLRRGEIIAFGAFPFTMLLSLTMVDLYRSGTHDWDTRYAPWPVKSAGAVNMTENEQILTLTVAAASAAVIGLIDFFIVRHKRAKQAQKLTQFPEAVPIILRKPLAKENREATPPEEDP